MECKTQKKRYEIRYVPKGKFLVGNICPLYGESKLDDLHANLHHKPSPQ
jgi:hypothetical protein